jgi:mannose-1-phosphate guanylyltransferase/mannose-6-phosphate isomerase
MALSSQLFRHGELKPALPLRHRPCAPLINDSYGANGADEAHAECAGLHSSSSTKPRVHRRNRSMSTIYPLIVCGGSGTRLWPASRASRPKQFLPLFGALSTFQQTLRRVSDADLFGKPVIVTNREHRFLVADQLQEIGITADILLEPEARDSGPAIAAGAAYISAKYGTEAVVLSLAADHMVKDVEGFEGACGRALRSAQQGAIVTFGVVPKEATSAYGYIEPGDIAEGGIVRIRRFVEKPDAETASRYVREGYLWNSGNFMFKAGVLLSEYAKQEPETVAAVREAVAQVI